MIWFPNPLKANKNTTCILCTNIRRCKPLLVLAEGSFYHMVLPSNYYLGRIGWCFGAVNTNIRILSSSESIIPADFQALPSSREQNCQWSKSRWNTWELDRVVIQNQEPCVTPPWMEISFFQILLYQASPSPWYFPCLSSFPLYFTTLQDAYKK